MEAVKTISNISKHLAELEHNQAIVINALTNDLKVKTLTVMFNSEDSWNGYSQFSSLEFVQSKCIKAITEDQTVIGYKATYYKINPDLSLVKTMETLPFFTKDHSST